MSLISGFCGFWILLIGLRSKILNFIAEKNRPLKETEIAKEMDFLPRFVRAWLLAAYTYKILEYDKKCGFSIDKDVKAILFDKTDPWYLEPLIKMIYQMSTFYGQYPLRMRDTRKASLSACDLPLLKTMALVTKSDFPKIRDILRKSNPGLQKKLESSGKILDIGAGLGEGAVYFCRYYRNCEVTGLDIDKKSLRLAKKKAASSFYKDRIKFLHLDAKKLNLRTKYDLIFMNLALHEIGRDKRSKIEFLKNCRKHLNPNGLLIISEASFFDDITKHRKTNSKILMGVELFEALLGDEITTIGEFRDILKKSGFKKIKEAHFLNSMRVFFSARIS